MGNAQGTEEERKLAEEEKTLELSAVSPDDVYSAFQSFLSANSMLDTDFQRFVQTNHISTDLHTEFYDALKASAHHYKPKLALMTLTLYSNATPEVKAGVMFAAYCEDGLADAAKLKKLVYNMIDVSVNVSRRLFSSDFKIRDYTQNLRKGRELLLFSLTTDLGGLPASREAFLRVVTSAEHRSLLSPTGVRRRLQELISANTSRQKSMPFLPAAAQ